MRRVIEVILALLKLFLIIEHIVNTYLTTTRKNNAKIIDRKKVRNPPLPAHLNAAEINCRLFRQRAPIPA